MQEQLERLSESGRGLSNNLKLLFVAVISFSLGVMATSFLETKDFPQTQQASLNQNNTSLEPTNTRKPFFVKVKEGSSQIIENLAHPRAQKLEDKPINTQSDFINLREKVEKFQDALDVQLRLKFKNLFQDDKNPHNTILSKVISQSVDLMFLEKKLFYRADFTEEFSGSKVVMFFNYFSCENQSVVKLPLKLIDICYTMTLFSLKRDQWSQTNIGSSAQGFFWKDGTPYSYIGLNGLGDFSKDTNINMAVVPVPSNQDSTIHFLRFVNEQFKWAEGPVIKWNDAGTKDAAKFEKWSNDYNEKYSARQE